MASDMDEILKEEIREYKETLTCPSCKVFGKTIIIYLKLAVNILLILKMVLAS